jgi:diguanylate cyclase
MTNSNIPKQILKALSLGIAILVVTFLVYKTGGIKHVYSHSMYPIILLAGFWFGVKGGVVTAIAAGLMLGPKMPMDVTTGELQTIINWMYRLFIFVGTGGIWGSIVDYLRSRLDMLKWAATHDPETGLATLSLLEDHFARLKAEQPADNRIVVSLCSVENHDEVVSAFGLRSGESVMLQFAERAEKYCPEGSVIFLKRMGKLIVLIPAAGNVEADIAPRIRQITMEPFSVDDIPIHLELSVGFMQTNLGTDDSALELVRKATIAQEEARHLDSEYAVFTRNLQVKPIEAISLIGELRRAINNDELYLDYQAKVGGIDRHLLSVEALVRWKHPRLGNISPGAFIPYAEKSDLINPMTDWVIEKALQQLKLWQKQEFFTRIAINISARNLQAGDFADRLMKQLERYNISPDSIELEVTEWTFMKNHKTVLETLDTLSKIPVFLAIDDFGTGYSSLQYINRIPSNSIKIDRSFIQQIDTYPSVFQVVRAAVRVGHALGMEVVAEGVETDSQYNMVQKAQCDAVQGFYIHRPSSPEELYKQFARKGTGQRN